MKEGEADLAVAVVAELKTRAVPTSRVTFLADGGISQTFELARGEFRPCLVFLARPGDRDAQNAAAEAFLQDALRIDGRGCNASEICNQLAKQLERDDSQPQTPALVLGIPGLGTVLGSVSTVTGTVTGTVSAVSGWLGRAVLPTALDAVAGVGLGGVSETNLPPPSDAAVQTMAPDAPVTHPSLSGSSGGDGGAAQHHGPESRSMPLDRSWAAHMFDPHPRGPELTQSVVESDFEVVDEDGEDGGLLLEEDEDEQGGVLIVEAEEDPGAYAEDFGAG